MNLMHELMNSHPMLKRNAEENQSDIGVDVVMHLNQWKLLLIRNEWIIFY